MTKKQLRKTSISLYKLHPGLCWILGIMCGLFETAVIALSFIIPFSSLLTFPLLVVPFIFASALSDILYEIGLDLTLKTFLKQFIHYFKPNYMKMFSVVRSFFKALLVLMTSYFLISFITYFAFEYIYGEEFIESYLSIVELMESETDTFESVYMSIMEEDSLIMRYVLVTTAPAICLFSISYNYLLFVSFENLYFSVNAKRKRVYNMALIRNAVKRTKRKYFKEFYSKFIYLNWPYFLLMAVGFACGFIISYMQPLPDYNSIVCGLVFGYFFSSFYLPFIFGNLRALELDFEDRYFAAYKEFMNETITRISLINNLTQEQREELKRQLESDIPQTDSEDIDDNIERDDNDE